MATVGSLFINVKARTSSFRKKMLGVGVMMKRLGAGFVWIAQKVALFGAAMAAVTVTAIIVLTKKGLAAVDSITKLARSLDTTTEGIITLQHAAVIGGVSIEKMDKAMGKMLKNVGEAKLLGTGEALEVFKALGLDLNMIAGLNADQMFGVIADGINKLGSAGERAAAANKIFGRTGVDLLNVIKEGSAGVEEMRNEVEDLGMVFTGEMGNQVEQANDAWARIGGIWRGLGNFLAIEFAPILTEIANRLRDQIKEWGGVDTVARFIVRAFFYVGAAVLDTVKVMKIAWFGLKSAVLQVAADITHGVSVAFHEIEVLTRDLSILTLKATGVMGRAYGWMADRAAEGFEELGADTVASWIKTSGTVARSVANVAGAIGGADWETDFKSDTVLWLEGLSQSLGDKAADSAGDLLDEFAKGWKLENVDDFINSLKDKFAGEGLGILTGGGAGIELTAPDIKQATESLQTAVGAFKVEASSQERILDRTLDVDQQQLKTSEKILSALTTNRDGGALV